jgi:hypothetical protein
LLAAVPRHPALAMRAATSMASGGSTTDTSTTDPDARLFRRGDGKEARLCFMVIS